LNCCFTKIMTRLIKISGGDHPFINVLSQSLFDKGTGYGRPSDFVNPIESLGEQSNIADQCLDIRLTENAAPGRHKPSFAVKDAFD